MIALKPRYFSKLKEKTAGFGLKAQGEDCWATISSKLEGIMIAPSSSMSALSRRNGNPNGMTVCKRFQRFF
jgi:hypothetical protein